MSFDMTVEEHNRITFRDQVTLAYQQLSSRLRDKVDEFPAEGETNMDVDVIMSVEAQEMQGRIQPNIDNPVKRERRWIILEDEIATGEPLPRMDRWRQAMNYESELMRMHMAAVNRKIDDRIIDAITGPAYTGKVATTPKTLGAGQTIDKSFGASDSGLTLAKIIRIREIFGLSEVDQDVEQVPCVAITWRQQTDLLGIDAAINKDKNDGSSPLTRGKVMHFMGLDFVLTNAIRPKEGEATTRICPVWMPSNIGWGVWQDIQSDLWNDSSKRRVPTFEVSCNMSGVRRREEGVILVECHEAPAA
ncbi:MAG: phage capsid protein [Pseudomonadota bacterium]